MHFLKNFVCRWYSLQTMSSTRAKSAELSEFPRERFARACNAHDSFYDKRLPQCTKRPNGRIKERRCEMRRRKQPESMRRLETDSGFDRLIRTSIASYGEPSPNSE